jgi:multidrug efflux pump subunit AcrA (membrane-fusion protein)
MDTYASEAEALLAVERRLRAIDEQLAPRERDVAALQEQLAPLERALAALRQKREELASAVTHLRNALEVDAPEDPSPPATERPPGGYEREADLGQSSRPKTIDGVVRILDDLGGEASLSEIRREFEARGWLDSFKNGHEAVFAATRRLFDHGRIERLGEGRYRLLPEQRNGSQEVAMK